MAKPNPPANPPADQERHHFTDAQAEMINFYRSQLSAAEQKLNEIRLTVGVFLDYIRKEHKLDERLDWSLTAGPDGKPFMQGSPRRK
jgi:hypothetical protein